MHIHEDLEYWGIDKNLMDACCAFTHYPELEVSRNELKRDQNNKEELTRTSREEDFGSTKIGQCRSFLWNLTEYPERSKPAKVGIQY